MLLHFLRLGVDEPALLDHRALVEAPLQPVITPGGGAGPDLDDEVRRAVDAVRANPAGVGREDHADVRLHDVDLAQDDVHGRGKDAAETGSLRKAEPLGDEPEGDRLRQEDGLGVVTGWSPSMISWRCPSSGNPPR